MGNKITAAKVKSITKPGMYRADDTLVPLRQGIRTPLVDTAHIIQG